MSKEETTSTAEVQDTQATEKAEKTASCGHEGCDHDHSGDQAELFLDEAFVAKMKERYPEPLWKFFEQDELFPEMDEMFKDITDFDLLRMHIDDLVRLALDEDILARDPNKEKVARAPHLALLSLAAMGLPESAMYENLAVLMEREEINGLVDYALFTLYRTNPKPSYEALCSYYDNVDTPPQARNRALSNLLSLPLQDPLPREERVKRVADFLYRPQSNNAEVNRQHNASLIELAMTLYEKTQDPFLTQLYPVIQETFEEGRVDTSVVTLSDLDATFGDYDVSVDILAEREPGHTLYLTCEQCQRIYAHDIKKVYYDPIVLHAHLDPEGIEEGQEEAAEITPVWIPEPFPCPKCGAINSYQLSFRGFKHLFADFMRMMKREQQGETYHSPYYPMSFTFLGRYTHPTMALELAYQALQEYPKAAGVRIELARLLTHMGDFREARAQLLQAGKDDPSEPGALLGLARLAEIQGNNDEAAEWWLNVQKHIDAFDVSQSKRRELLHDVEQALTRLKGTQFAVQQTHTKVGRNEPCPCGSGKKYKHCCLKTAG